MLNALRTARMLMFVLSSTDRLPRFSVHKLVNVYLDLVVFTRIAGTSYTGSGRYWC